jgi:chaperonin cofactor prefoldin
MATTKEAISKLEAHERECTIRYENIERRLEDGSKRFDKLENMIWAVYPFILLSVVLSRFV